MSAPRELPGDRASLSRSDLRAAMQTAQRQRRRAVCPRCGTHGSRTHQDFFSRRLHVVTGIVISYVCVMCSRSFRKTWAL